MLEKRDQNIQTGPSNSDIRDAHLENLQRSQALSQLLRRASLMEVGLLGHVTQIDLDIAEENDLEPLNSFEKWLLKPFITELRRLIRGHIRQTLIDRGYPDQDDWR